MTEIVAGVPTELAGARRGPGRAVLLPPLGHAPPDPVLCQGADAADLPVRPAARQREDDRPVRVVPVPDRVGRSALAAALAAAAGAEAGRPEPPGSSGDTIAVGLGGDDCRPVRLDVGKGALVVGPPGSGRSSALAVIAAAMLAAGRPIVVVARDGPLRDLGTTLRPHSTAGFVPAAIGQLLDAAPAGAVLLVDDLDALEQQHPAVGDRLAAAIGSSFAGSGFAGSGFEGSSFAGNSFSAATPLAPGNGAVPRATVVVAAAQTARAAAAYRGALGALRGLRAGLVLAPAELGSGEVFGVGLDWLVDPTQPHAPGRGVRQQGRDVVAVQLLHPELP